MTTNDTKQNLTEEAMPVDAAELDEEMLEDLSGGAIGPFRELTLPSTPAETEKPKDGGSTTTGSW